MRRSALLLLVAAALAAGCGAAQAPRIRAIVPAPHVTSVAPAAAVHEPQPAPAPDPVALLISQSQQHFRAGETELRLGHLEKAKSEFDRAVDVVLESKFGARTDQRISDYFSSLLNSITNYELAALAQGDGFTEKHYEPASIDELLSAATFPVPEPRPELKRAVENDLRATTHDLPIRLNKRVLSFIELFQGRLHDYLQDGMRRAGRYLPLIQNVFKAEGLPLDLAYVPLIESAFKPDALSRKRAKGIWQFVHGTGRENGLTQNWFVDERSNPEKATEAAARYLKGLYQTFSDWHLVLAAYNSGPGRVQRAIEKTRLNSFWALSATRYLPRETKDYVPMILAAIVIARNPSLYGFDFQPEPPLAYDKVRLPHAVDLRTVAEMTDATLDEIQFLNPELRRLVTPVRYPDFELKVPAGTGEKLREALDQLPEQRLNTLRSYTVRRGDTLASIAWRYGVSRTTLAEANLISRKGKVAPGQELIIPNGGRAVLSDRAPQVARAELSGRHTAMAAPLAEATVGKKIIYEVKRGDTLSSIASLFRTSVRFLKSWNRIAGHRIKPGDRLTIFLSKNAAKSF